MYRQLTTQNLQTAGKIMPPRLPKLTRTYLAAIVSLLVVGCVNVAPHRAFAMPPPNATVQIFDDGKAVSAKEHLSCWQCCCASRKESPTIIAAAGITFGDFEGYELKVANIPNKLSSCKNNQILVSATLESTPQDKSYFLTGWLTKSMGGPGIPSYSIYSGRLFAGKRGFPSSIAVGISGLEMKDNC